MGEQKKKHHLWGLWVPLIVVAAIIILPISIIAILFFDPSHVDTGITETKEKSAIFGTVLTNMFDDCRSENPQMNLTITQNDLNQLLYNAQEQIKTQNPKVGEYLKQFSIQIRENTYLFDIEISAFNILKTHIKIETEIKSDVALENGSQAFVFSITDFKVGRLGGLQGGISWAANNMGLDLSGIFETAGLSIQVDLDNLKMIYDYKDFVKDMSNMVGSDSSFFVDIFSNFLTENIISFSQIENESIKGNIPLGEFLANPEYTNSNYVINPMAGESGDIPLLVYNNSISEKLIDDGIIASDEKTANNGLAVTKFLSYGQDYLNNNEKTYVTSIYDDIKDTYCNGLDIATYSANAKSSVFGSTEAGIMDKVTKEVNDKITANLLSYQADIMAGKNVYVYDSENPLVVTDDEVRTMLKANTGLIGYGFSFAGKTSENKAKLAYAILDNVYPTIIPAKEAGDANKMALTFGLNINGAETSLILPMEASDISSGQKFGLGFNISNADLLFGTREFSNLKSQLQTIMNGAAISDSMISFTKDSAGNVQSLNMVFDFDDYFKNNSGSQFSLFNELAKTQGAHLVAKFGFASSANDAPGTRCGQFNIQIGYERNS